MQSPTRAIGELLGYAGDARLLLTMRAVAVKRIRQALRSAPTLRAAADRMGVPYRTLARWRAQCPDLASDA